MGDLQALVVATPMLRLRGASRGKLRANEDCAQPSVQRVISLSEPALRSCVSLTGQRAVYHLLGIDTILMIIRL